VAGEHQVAVLVELRDLFGGKGAGGHDYLLARRMNSRATTARNLPSQVSRRTTLRHNRQMSV
jgi:hypothetical protein